MRRKIERLKEESREKIPFIQKYHTLAEKFLAHGAQYDPLAHHSTRHIHALLENMSCLFQLLSFVSFDTNIYKVQRGYKVIQTS